MKDNEIYEEQRKLVLERFKTLHPNLKIMLGSEGELTVKELIKHIESNNEFGKNIVKVQIKMLKLLMDVN